jgi:cell division protein FtsW (lipid II flippase)
MWLAAAGVTVVEAYTLPAALLAFAAGTFVSERTRAWSWSSLGPAIVLALAPTVGLALARHDDGRAIAAGVAALVILLAGARRQLQAPLVLGAIALVALGVDKIGPQAARLPRWTMLAIAGALLLWVGTTFERRRDEMHRAARRLAGLR